MSNVAERIAIEVDGLTIEVERLEDGSFRKPDYLAGAEREVVGQRSVSRDYSRNGKKGDMAISDEPVHAADIPITAPATPEAQLWDGWGTALKPAAEFWWLAYKPREGTYANNALTHGVAGLWIDGARVGDGSDIARIDDDGNVYYRQKESLVRPRIKRDDNDVLGKGLGVGTQAEPDGRFPANVVHDGSDEVLSAFPETEPSRRGKPREGKSGDGYGMTRTGAEYDDFGSAARFFYCAKAKRRERWFYCSECDAAFPMSERDQHNGVEAHPTVKPLSLMRYLCRLTRTPTGGVVLDPFAGSGSTLVAAVQTGRDYIGIEQESKWYTVCEARVAKAAAEMGGEIKAKEGAGKKPIGDLPLFSGMED